MKNQFQQQIAFQKLCQEHGQMDVIEKLRGSVLNGRFKIRSKLSEGSFGQIYTGYDTMSKKNGVKNPVIIKFTQNHAMNDQEFEALTSVYEFAQLNNSKETFANTYNKGKVLVQDKALAVDQDKIKKIQKKDLTEDEYQVKQLETQVWSYIVQDKLGKTLEDYLFERNEAFTEKTVLQIGIQLLDSLKLIHNAGFLYNDLKLNNIVIGDAEEHRNQTKSLHKIRIIDFGLAQKYYDSNGNHIQMKKQGTFKGNIIFASKNAFNLLTQSRRDDLISLCYFLLYTIDGDLPFLLKQDDNPELEEGMSKKDKEKNQQKEFQRIKELKNILSPELLCESPEAKILLPFIEEVFNLGFEDTPDYDKLRFYLVKGVLDLNETPNKEFDWNIAFAQGTNELEERPENISSESLRGADLRIAEEDCFIEDLEESKRSEDCEMHSGEMDQKIYEPAMMSGFRSSSRDNLDRKMSMHGGYQFHHNTNQEAMQKRVVQEPLGASVIKMNMDQNMFQEQNQIQENQPSAFAMAVQCENDKHQRIINAKLQAQRKANGLNHLFGQSASQTSDISPRD